MTSSTHTTTTDELRLAKIETRAAQKTLVAVNHSACFIVAVSWLRALLITVGVAKIPLMDTVEAGFSFKQAVAMILWTVLLTWFLLYVVNWLLDVKVVQNKHLKSLKEDSASSKFSHLAFATACDFCASAGAYAVMYSWAVTVLGCLDTSSILRLWAGVILATLFVCILVVAGDKGSGPLKELNRLKTAGKTEHYEQLRFLLTFNVGFVLAFVWEGAAELTFFKIAPEVHSALWARWTFCISLIAICFMLLALRQILAVHLKKAKAASSSSNAINAPLLPTSLRSYEDPTKEAFQMALDTTTHGLTLVGAIALSFNVATSLNSIKSPSIMLYAWLAYTIGVTVVFSIFTAYLEDLLVTKALSLASAAGMTLPDVAAAISGGPVPADNDSTLLAPAAEQASHVEAVGRGSADVIAIAMASKPPGGQGLLWYQKNVILPIAEAASGRLLLMEPGDHVTPCPSQTSLYPRAIQDGFAHMYRTSLELRNIVLRPDPGNKAVVIANFSFLERHVESINVAVAWTVGFAWTNVLSLVLVGVPAQLAPVVNHYWFFAIAVTAVAVAVDLIIVEIHSYIWSQGLGL
ncbi:hypothetical protein CEUSTIGMA_g2779.t1 [Chlamydomonas eustigma]|uniref:Transmembrane protein n=1 Tax=Chlamydomonas eustigma TaxID=1157962 RepID=A0A250WWX7_9CHLO|nr:hypothetical protein CEUSTIGMA_g2779.t1 [Chlamydomonas eustigma]|eukprot:GAX75334.1 hypothetical protein CEUSTIGMA_g2779.t1 [Chlamydomonas eustigma]